MPDRPPRAATAVAALLLAGAAHAQTASPLAVAQLAAGCANCHGTGGQPVPGSELHALAGMPKADLLATLMAFKAGTKPSTLMHQLTKGYTDAQLEQIAGWFASRKP